jgi:hypothetical protein
MISGIESITIVMAARSLAGPDVDGSWFSARQVEVSRAASTTVPHAAKGKVIFMVFLIHGGWENLARFPHVR